jgi:1-acyl-sn-glycerol-3-phosphate acyltransferase
VLRALSYAYWAFICVTCPLWYAAAVVIWAVTRPFDRRRVLLHLFCSLWATSYVRINPLWRLETTGRDRLPWRGPAVLVANHASLIDILVLYSIHRPFKWVSKKENFRIPVVGWGMYLNDYVPVVRGDRASVLAMMAECDRLLGEGSPVLFFPEGTRTRDGRLLPFKDGAFELALRHGVPVIPIAVHGTGRALPKHGLVLEEHVDAKVEVLEPLLPAEHPTVARLRDAARERLALALGEGMADGPAERDPAAGAVAVSPASR